MGLSDKDTTKDFNESSCSRQNLRERAEGGAADEEVELTADNSPRKLLVWRMGAWERMQRGGGQ